MNFEYFFIEISLVCLSLQINLKPFNNNNNKERKYSLDLIAKFNGSKVNRQMKTEIKCKKGSEENAKEKKEILK